VWGDRELASTFGRGIQGELQAVLQETEGGLLQRSHAGVVTAAAAADDDVSSVEGAAAEGGAVCYAGL
jgi:hypothetical protein